jgi:alpha-glucosidase (family GH31 glycosyl hydrolase)
MRRKPHSSVSRRQAIQQLGAASAGVMLTTRFTRGQQQEIVVAGRPVEWGVATVSAATIRLTIRPIEDGRAVDVFDDGAVVAEGTLVARVAPGTSRDAVRTGDFVVTFSPDRPSVQIAHRGNVIQRLTLPRDSGDVTFLLPKGPLLGMGQGGPQFDRRGNVDEMRNGQGGFRLRTHGGRVPIQWLVGTDGWAMFIHQPLGRFDLTGTEATFTPTSRLLPLDIFVVVSNDPSVIMKEYAGITGHAEMPPLWTFGYQQSHRTLAGPEEIRTVARTLREKMLPCDTLIYLGTGFTPSGWNTKNGEFGWNASNFPDPKAAIDELHAMHFHVVLHDVIEGQRLNGTVRDACKAPEPSGTDAAGRWPDDRSVGCYWPYHKPLFDLGIDGLWPDQGDGLDGPSRLARIRMHWEGPQLYRPNERPYALHRNGYPGMGRYGAFLWSGDVYTTWETLKTHVPVAINSGLSGIPYWGTDIGGFVPTAEYTGELHVRWFQFGAFCTLFRAHGRTWHLRLPWGWNTGDAGLSEIVNYRGGAADPDPSELRNPHVEPICRKYMNLRYQLLPYIQTAVRECHDTGMPIMRALWLHYPDDPSATARGDEYLWGRDILVAPVTDKGATDRSLYLPRGTWFDFWSHERLEGGREIQRKVDLETTPLYVRAGAILPLGPVKQYKSQPVDGPMTIVVYPGRDGAFTLYEDDGATFDYRKGEFMRIEMVWRDAERRLTLQLAAGSKMLPPSRRQIEVRLAGQSSSQPLVFEGKPISVRLS